ncbi:MAG: DUF4307 domain-containing protein [Micromonosporaceae bacterium]|nr:DUF4307 domain-containing protein [Micromonosporaceae bacterium]
MTHPAAPLFPPGRYGRRREPHRTPRWLPYALAIVTVLGTLLLARYLYTRYGTDAYQATVIGYTDISAAGTTVTLRVQKRDRGPAVCRIHALDNSAAEVGYAEVPVGAGTDVTLRYRLQTSGLAHAVDVLGCRVAH